MGSAGPQRKRHGRGRHPLHWLELIALALPVVAGLLFITKPDARWPDALFLAAMAVATLVAMRSDLPLQNVLSASVVILILAGLLEVLGTVTPFPFGPRTYREGMGDPLFGSLPWAAPVFWLALLPNARGVARLILQRRRTDANYGLWVIGLAAVLVFGFGLGMELMAQSRGYWHWSTSSGAFGWHGAPWAAFFGYAITTVLILVLAMPMLIRKQPGHARPNYRHVYLWLVLSILPAVTAFKDNCWAGLGLTAISGLVPALLACRHRPHE